MGLDTVELAMEIEKHFNIEPSDKEWSEVNRVYEIHGLIIRHLPEGQFTSEEVMTRVIELIAEKSGNEIDEIKTTDSLTDDLGMD
jgi:acyl carrier protein